MYFSKTLNIGSKKNIMRIMKSRQQRKEEKKVKKEQKELKKKEEKESEKKDWKPNVTPDRFIDDYTQYKEFCGNEKNTGLCDTFVKTYYQNKELSSKLTRTRFATFGSIMWSLALLAFLGLLIYVVVVYLVPLLTSLGDLNFEDMFGGIGE